jgi:hypothetical protein
MRDIPPETAIDRDIVQACEKFSSEIDGLSRDPLLREGLLRAAIGGLAKALERDFDGYQDVLGDAFLAQSELVLACWNEPG